MSWIIAGVLGVSGIVLLVMANVTRISASYSGSGGSDLLALTLGAGGLLLLGIAIFIVVMIKVASVMRERRRGG